MSDLIPAMITILPLIVLAFVFRWVRQIKINSDFQVEQNNKIITLLENSNKKR